MGILSPATDVFAAIGAAPLERGLDGRREHVRDVGTSRADNLARNSPYVRQDVLKLDPVADLAARGRTVERDRVVGAGAAIAGDGVGVVVEDRDETLDRVA